MVTRMPSTTNYKRRKLSNASSNDSNSFGRGSVKMEAGVHPDSVSVAAVNHVIRHSMNDACSSEDQSQIPAILNMGNLEESTSYGQRNSSRELVTSTMTNDVGARKRGRPRKSEIHKTPDAQTPDMNSSQRRRSSRALLTEDKFSKSHDIAQVGIATPIKEVIDTRKRHANGKPMGRPRKSDAKDVKPDVEEGSSLPSARLKEPRRLSQRSTRNKIATSFMEDKHTAGDSLLSKKRLDGSPPEIAKNKKTPRFRANIRKQPRTFRLLFETKIADPIITQPAHLVPAAKHQSFVEYLDSFQSLDEDVPSSAIIERRHANRQLRERIYEARKRGVSDSHGLPRASELKSGDPPVRQSYLDHLASQACYFSKLMQDERRRNLVNARKISSMIQAHFKRIENADERKINEMNRVMRQLAKRTANEVRRKWRLAEKEVQRRIQSKLAAEQRAAGKEHLQNILRHSSNLLGVQIKGHGDTESPTFEEYQSYPDVDEDEDHYMSIEDLRQKYANLSSEKPYGMFDRVTSPLAVDDPSQSLSASVDTRPASNSSPSSQCTRQQLSHDSDDSPMDSEMDQLDEDDDGENSDLSSVSSSAERLGLAYLYPELARHRTSLLQDVESPSDIVADKNISFEPSPQTPILEVLPSTTKRAEPAEEFLELATDDELHDYRTDIDEPMDSEDDSVDEIDSRSSDNAGPGLAWLYADRPIKAFQEEVVPSICESPANPRMDVPDIKDITKATSDTSMRSPVQTTIPALLRGTLREYQHVGLDWMASLFLNGTNGILADEMGLGKTIQTISLLAWLACEKHIWGTHLIVVPTSVMLNWETEFKKFAPGLKVLTYYGTPRERKEKRKGWSRPDVVHVVITSYQLVITDAPVFRRKQWEYMILDEAHNIKNFKSQRWQTLLNFNTQHRLLLTGTPLQNNLTELWSLLYFLMPQGLAENASFANLAEFQEWFGRPVDRVIEEGGKIYNDETRKTVAKLHQILRPYILRRLKADVEKQMPGKFEHLITCKLSKRQRFLYDDFMSRSGTRAIMQSGNFLSIINCFMQLRKVCNHPDLFESRPVVTSLAMHRSAIAAYEIKELLIRKFSDSERSSIPQSKSHFMLNIGLCELESQSGHVKSRILDLCEYPDHDMLKFSSIEDPLSESIGRMQSIERMQTHLRQLYMTTQEAQRVHKFYVNQFRCTAVPVYGTDLIRLVGNLGRSSSDNPDQVSLYGIFKPSLEYRVSTLKSVVQKFACITPKVVVVTLGQQALSSRLVRLARTMFGLPDCTHFARTATAVAFPDKRLLQYDCGKLQRLESLLRELIPNGHRVLIFTQMTKMLDILEQFLNIHGYRYFRLDGSTKIEARQTLTERFNKDLRIPVFILSTRSGGLGINLTGADTVIFYDSDWNPCMDRQCQDRAHRIGQTRDVHIYRLVSEYTIEQNIMRKANQKRMLDEVVIGEGDFTTEFFNRIDWKDMLGEDMAANVGSTDGIDYEQALAAAEDEDDAQAARVAQKEMDIDIDVAEFSEKSKGDEHSDHATYQENEELVPAGLTGGTEIASIDDYMIRFLEQQLSELY